MNHDTTGSRCGAAVLLAVLASSCSPTWPRSEHATVDELTVSDGLTVLAGVPSGKGRADGLGSAARFFFGNTGGVAVDGSGNIYVADSGNHTIRKVSPAGVVTTLAGTAGQSGNVDATGSAARFYSPCGVAVDGSGNVYVADNSTIRKVTPAGVVTTLAGAAGQTGSIDGTGSAARFNYPWSVAVDGSGNVYVADTNNHTIRKVTSAGDVTTLAGAAGLFGSVDGTGSAARFKYPEGVAVDAAGNVYVADSSNHTIRTVTPAGQVTTLAGAAGQVGSVDGTGSAARFWIPANVAVDGSGNIYVADNGNNTIREVTPTGIVATLAGAAGQVGSADGTGSAARFNRPFGVAVYGSGNVYVTDSHNNTIRNVTPAGVATTLAGAAGQTGSVDGAGGAALFSGPRSVAVDGSGNVYVADFNNNTIRKVTSAGIVTTLAGAAGQFGSVNGTGSAARFNRPYSVAVDGAANVYVADIGNHTIRKVSLDGIVTTLAGAAGQIGSVDGTGSAARFNSPSGVTVDGAGTVYVADSGNSTIRKVSPAGVVTTLAGAAGQMGSVDATGSAARFKAPMGVAVDAAGNVYVADYQNHTIRRVTPDGVVTTLAGTAGQIGSVEGTGSAARFFLPRNVAVDGSGNVYVADSENNAIRKITPAGVVTTIIGVLSPSIAATIPGPLPASLAFPYAVAVGQTGTIYVAVEDAVLVAVTNPLTLTTGGGTLDVTAGDRVALGVSGGYGGYVWTITVNNSGGSITPDGVYTAGFNVNGGTDTVTVTDSNGESITITIRSRSPAGRLALVAGVPSGKGRADGLGSAARFFSPEGVAVDGAGNLYVADYQNHTIRRVTPAGVVTTLAGAAGQFGSVDGTSSAARFWVPTDVAVDRWGNVYVADYGNHTIRKVSPAGVVTTLAGAAGQVGSADGTGSGARFNRPSGVAVDVFGSVYVADQLNHTIRKVTSAGVVTTLAGMAGQRERRRDGFRRAVLGTPERGGGRVGQRLRGGYLQQHDSQGDPGGRRDDARRDGRTSGSADGTGSAARFYSPTGVAVDGCRQRLRGGLQPTTRSGR